MVVIGERSSCEASETKRRWLFRALFQPLQHAVHGGGQPADLVVGLGLRHPAVQLRGRDLVHLPPDRLDGRQRAADGEPGGERDHHHHHRQPDDEQLDDDGGGVKDIDQRPGHQDDSRTVGGLRALATATNSSSSSGVTTWAVWPGANRATAGLPATLGLDATTEPAGVDHLNQLFVVRRSHRGPAAGPPRVDRTISAA